MLKIWINENKLFVGFLILLILLRILILNVNYTEWGDAFRFIRGAEYLTRFSWAWDEKRLPFYSILLVPGILLNIPIIWGRFLALLVSTGIIFCIYYFYLKFFDDNKKYALLASVFTITTPVIAYWNIRIMADGLFALLVLVCFTFYLNTYFKSKDLLNPKGRKLKSVVLLSIILLMVTMTRFEGIFVLTGIGFYFLITKKFKDLLIVLIPQLLVYFPWTVYTKFLYQGPVQQNDYFDEVQTFVFNLTKLNYFFVYSLFILLIPILLFFLVLGVRYFLRDNKMKTDLKVYLPIGVYIALTLIIGFIWTPSLPRIYLPIIPYISMLFVYGLQKVNIKKVMKYYVLSSIFLLVIFAIEQYKFKLYFLGASKIAFAGVIVGTLCLIFLPLVIKRWKILFAGVLIGINLLVSFLVISNEKDSYKSIKQALEYLELNVPISQKVAYSDETGNSTWYLRKNGIRPDFDKDLNYDSQYEYLKENGVNYLLWTNEFNRGSAFVDPKKDSNFERRYILESEYEDRAIGTLGNILSKLGLVDTSGYFIFKTKVYKVI